MDNKIRLFVKFSMTLCMGLTVLGLAISCAGCSEAYKGGIQSNGTAASKQGIASEDGSEGSGGDSSKGAVGDSSKGIAGEGAKGAVENGAKDDAGTVADDERFDTSLFAMDTYMTLTAFGPDAQEALSKAVVEIAAIESRLSTGDEDSEVSVINQKGGGRLSEVGTKLMGVSLRLWEDTGGCFNPAIYPVMKLWGFADGNFHVPDRHELEKALGLLDVSRISFDSSSGEISFGLEGMAIDFGGIAKGYTSSRIMEIFAECGVASGMVNLGGNVQTYGTKPDGSLWRIAIQDPEKGDKYLCVLETHDKAVITSGGYERYFEEGGVTYHHIIDPSDGYPADSGLVSVSVICDDGTLADGLSTSLFVMGKDRAVDFWRTHGDSFEMVLFADDGVLYVTEGLKDVLTSDYKTEYVSR